MDLKSGGVTVSNVERIFTNIKWRFGGIVKALTSEVEEFYKECDPEKENLSLYGLPDGSWKVAIPTEEVPPDLPEPALGINFARDEMSQKEWLTLVALHSDAWLTAMASFYSAGLTRSERKRVFMLISDLPTAYDIITGRDAGDENESSVDQINNGKEGHQDHACETSSRSRFPFMNYMDLPRATMAEQLQKMLPPDLVVTSFAEGEDKGESHDAVSTENRILSNPTFSLEEKREVPHTQETLQKVNGKARKIW
ncbi:hypothetical protein R1flu_018263 [Riccia fluitans]|uniref:Alfin N-terminal domain-containing protein n=1 Tax=Riccia fluitans TaxID=41844 RepID=A0ABD1ZGM2_9MARC